MSLLISLGVAGIAIAALVSPFTLKRPGVLPFNPRDVELAAGPRTVRTILFATFLLAGASLGIYVGFVTNQYWLAFGGSFLVLLMSAVILPESRIRTLCLKMLEFYLVALAIVIVISSVAHLWVAGTEARALLPRARGMWIDFDGHPFIFWYSVAGSGVLLWAALYGLREYFTRVVERLSGRGDR